jgi:hypothetical protein
MALNNVSNNGFLLEIYFSTQLNSTAMAALSVTGSDKKGFPPHGNSQEEVDRAKTKQTPCADHPWASPMETHTHRHVY